MKFFSVYDLPPGADSAEFLATGSPLADGVESFAQADVRFYGRGDRSALSRHDGRELLLVVMQGRGRLVVDGVEHPITAGDVALLQKDDEFAVHADDVDPPVVLTVGVRT